MVTAVNQLKSLLADKQATLLIFLCVLAVYGLSYYKRQASYTYWLENPSEYVVENVTAMSTMDAYWWLKIAKDMDEGRTGKDLTDPIKEDPDLGLPENPTCLQTHQPGQEFYRWRATRRVAARPILAGIRLSAFSIQYLFGLAILGGLVGSFSWAYYSRSAMGCADTDLLNLFFPMAVSALVVQINKERTFRANLLLAVGAGLMMYLFNWWYQLPLFFLVYLVFIAAYLFLVRLPWKQIAWLLLAFALASGPHYVWQSIDSLQNLLAAFFSPKITGQIVWPDIMTTIQEVRTSDLVTKLKDLYDFLPVVFAGLAGLLWLYIVRCKQMVPITPLVLIGIWSLFGPVRFTMYLSPFIGIGAGVLIELVARQAGKKFRLHPLATSVLAIALMLAIFFPTISDTAYNYIPGPAVPAEMTKAFLEIKRIVPKHSAMFSWWADGYPLMEIGEFATYHDNRPTAGFDRP
jgi:dolichyl-diphosphooligosaccharide--protein glycosyltransferase